MPRAASACSASATGPAPIRAALRETGAAPDTLCCLAGLAMVTLALRTYLRQVSQCFASARSYERTTMLNGSLILVKKGLLAAQRSFGAFGENIVGPRFFSSGQPCQRALMRDRSAGGWLRGRIICCGYRPVRRRIGDAPSIS